MRKKIPLWVRVINTCLVLPLIMATMPGPAFAAGQTGRVSPGIQASENLTEGYLDLLAPVAGSESSVFFLNPKISGNDNEEQELNLGAGFRHLLADPGAIIGANLFFDTRETANDERFDQIGAGLEVLTSWVDARANYYRPDDDNKMVNTYGETEVINRAYNGYGDPYATGNEIQQQVYQKLATTTINRQYEQFEAAMEGYDLELGVRLPVFTELFETRILGGYYDFDSDFSSGPEGFRGRLEIRALPALTLDAVVFEDDDLTGSDYFVGARLNLPFDVGNLAKGRNPFEGASGYFRPGRGNLSDRLTEMVIRDINIRTEKSGFIENEAARQQNTVTRTTGQFTATVMDEITFVNNNTASGTEDGTAENPYTGIQEGITNAFGTAQRVYVFAGALPYLENVVLEDGTTLMGEGCAIVAGGGREFGGDVAPVVDGRSLGPTFTMADMSMLRGFEIVNSDLGGPDQDTPVGSSTYDISRVGVYANNATFYFIECNNVQFTQYGALLGGTNEFVAVMNGNRFSSSEIGAMVDGMGGGTGAAGLSSGTNRYDYNASHGLMARLSGYATTTAALQGDEFSHNAGNGVDLSVNATNLASVFMIDSLAVSNGASGMNMTGFSGGDLLVLASNVVASFNGVSGMNFSLNASRSAAAVIYSGEANENGNMGVNYFASAERSIFALNGIRLNDNAGSAGLNHTASVTDYAALGLENAIVQNNAGAGIQSTISSAGDALLSLVDFNARSNGSHGVYASMAAAGDVSMLMQDVVMDRNGSDGASFFASCASNLIVQVTNATLNGNGGAGLNLSASSGGEQMVILGSFRANDNTTRGMNASLSGSESIILGLIGASFNRNGADGAMVSMSSGDEAFFVGSDIQANDNSAAGIMVAQAGSEGATVNLENADADRNGTQGISISHSSGGEIATVIQNGSASGNAEAGVSINASASSNTMIIVSDFSANDNGLGGVVFSTSSGGAGTIVITNVTASRNGASGIYGTISTSGEISAQFEDVTVNRNADHGIDFVASSASRISTGIEGVTANNNTNRGVDVTANTSDDLLFLVLDSQASGNGSEGMNLVASGAGEQTIAFQNAVFNSNGQGLGVNASAGGSVFSYFEDVRAEGNDTDGIALLASTSSNHVLFADGMTARYNGGNGLRFLVTASGGTTGILNNVVSRFNDGAGLSITNTSSAGSAFILGDTVNIRNNTDANSFAAIAPAGSAVISFVNTLVGDYSASTLSGGGGTNQISILP